MKSERRRIWNCLLVAVLVTVLAFVSGACAADTYTVCPSGCNYTSIQAAIDDAQPGDTIIVRDGTYTENMVVDVVNLTLQSEHGSVSTTVLAAVNTSDVFRVTANSVTITGFTVRNAIDSASGIHLHAVHHCTVSGNNASDNYRGIYLYSSSNNNLTGNTANSNKQPSIYLSSSSNNNNLTGNIANSNNFYGIYLHSSSNNNNLTGNTANSNNFYGIYLDSSSNNNTLVGNTADSNSYRGIFLWSSSNNSLTGNTASNNSYGIYLDYYSSNNNLTGNTALNNSYHGIYLYSSSNNNLTGNTALNNFYGIYLDYYSSNNSLTGNTISNNSNSGISLYSSSDNDLTGNNVSNNYRGVYLSSSSNDNHIYNNYFDNAINAYDDGNNTWNISKTSGTNIISGLWLGGNYWSDYTGKDTDSDGIGNTRLPYNSSGNILNGGDCLPLVYPPIFDTNEGNYPSISGNHNGTITPFYDINVSVLYTYPCPGTGGQAEYVKIWNSTTGWNVTATWDGYTGDWHNLTFNNSFTLYANETYNYTIRTGSYPQIIHEPSWNATGGVITCTEFVDLNGQQHEGWIPAIRLC